MTTHRSPHQPPAEHPHHLSVDGPGDLIAAIPALLGFVPENSLVLVCLVDGTVEAVMRHDLLDHADGHRVHPDMFGILERFADVCEREGVGDTVAVVIGADTEPGDHWSLVDTLDDELAVRNVRLADAHFVERIEPGERWTSLRPFVAGGPLEKGILPDPYSSSVTAAHVLRGRQIHRSRDELARLLAPAGPEAQAALAQARERAAYADNRSDADALSDVLTYLAEASGSGDVPVVAAADVSVCLERIDVRDVALAFSLTELAPGAELMWEYLTRTLTGAAVADPATLLAYGAYLHGEGPLAGVALDIARSADPSHRLSALLDTSLQNGMRPSTVRELTAASVDIARRLKVPLPPRDRG